jgi:hypothetical protein
MELVVVMGVIGAAVTTALLYNGRIQRSKMVQDVATATETIATNIQNSFNSIGDFSSVSASTIGNGKLYAPPITFDGTNLNVPWGQTLTPYGERRYFGLKFQGCGMTADICMQLASILTPKATTGYVWNGSSWAVYKSQVSNTYNQATLVSGCNTSCTGLEFEYLPQ